MEESKLVELAKSGDRQALAQLVKIMSKRSIIFHLRFAGIGTKQNI